RRARPLPDARTDGGSRRRCRGCESPGSVTAMDKTMSNPGPLRPLDPAVLVARDDEDVVVGEEIVRHRLASRVVHWTVALGFFLSLATGMPIWMPLFGWMAALFGGLSVCRVLHPWFGLAFFGASAVMFFEWIGDMVL